MPDRTEALALRLRQAIEHLRQERLPEAISELEVVCEDEALAAADDLRDVRARALSLWADALIRTDRGVEAEGPVREALALLKELGDQEGHREVQGLWARVQAAREAAAATRRREAAAHTLRKLSLDELEARFGDRPLAHADVLVKKANAELEVGVPEQGLRAARLALDLATSDPAGVREEVFARVALARLLPEEAAQHLAAAWRRAERASEFNLVSAVARAAEAQGVPLPVQVGPDLAHLRAPSGTEDDDPNDVMG